MNKQTGICNARSRFALKSTKKVVFSTTLMLLALCLGVGRVATPGAIAQSAATQDQRIQNIQDVVAKQAALVTEFDVNGLKVLVKRREGSLTVAAGLFFKGGSRNVTAENAGVEALMLSVATEASVGFPREKMRDELSRLGTVIGSSSTNDYSALSLASTRRDFDRSWEIFADVALHPAFTKEDFLLVQKRTLAGLQNEADNPESYLQLLQDEVAYSGHPYANRAEGTEKTIASLSVDALKQYHQKVMETSRLLLVVVGDLDATQLKPKIAASFGKLPKGNYKGEPVAQLSFDKSSVAVTPRSLPTNYVQGLFSAPPLTSPDIYPMRVGAAILRDRVFEEVRVKRNLSYAPDAFLRTQGANVGGLYVTAVDANQSVRLMLDEIGRLQHEPISNDDIRAVVAQYLTTYYMGQETNAAQAGDLAQAELIGGGWRNAVELINRLRAVTPADVQRVAQKYMRNIRFVVLGDPKAINTGVFTGETGE